MKEALKSVPWYGWMLIIGGTLYTLGVILIYG